MVSLLRIFFISIFFILFDGSQGNAFLDFFRAYTRQSEEVFDETIFGYCSSFKPPFQRSISDDWVNAINWRYIGTDTIQYSGKEKPRDKHFWLWFWKKDRWWTKSTLLKNDHFCKQTEITGEIQLNGAKEAGFVFRSRGTFDFWAVLLSAGKATLVWVEEGKKKELSSIPCPMSQWTLLKISDQMADVVIACGLEGRLTTFDRTLKDDEEIMDQHQGAAGLITIEGGALFRGVTFGPVDWSPDLGSVPEMKKAARVAAEPDRKKMARKAAKRDLRGILDDLLNWCPSPSLCAFDPYRVKKRPET